MDPRSGEVFGPMRTPVDVEPGDLMNQDMLTALRIEKGDLTPEELRAEEHLKEGEQLVAITEEVAHAQRVGQRQLERRRKRKRGLKGIAGA